jgi:S-formylglutathione hydrolase FrmB
LSAGGEGDVVRYAGWITLGLLLVPLAPATANPVRIRIHLNKVEHQIHGKLLNFTRHGPGNHRIWSAALCEDRDLFVYLPPGFDPHQQYPLIFWLHGFAQDESTFLEDALLPLDQAMSDGRLPPAIIAAPDASLRGYDCLFSPGSFFLNTRAGNYEDFLMHDVWNFVTSNYPIRPEPEAHAIIGISMGGGAAYNKIFKFPDHFRIAVGVFPPLNLRWQDCHGHYMANFNPGCWGWRTDFSRRRDVVGRFYGVPIRLGRLLNPLYPRSDKDVAAQISRDNPIEMLEAYNVRPGQFEMYVGYGGKDQFNIDAQVESFLYAARCRGLHVSVGYVPNGHHDRKTAIELLPGILDWLAPRLAPYAPPSCAPPPEDR